MLFRSIVMGCLYDYFQSVQEQQLKDELRLAAYGVEESGESYLEKLTARDYRYTWRPDYRLTPYYYNNKKRGELDFVIELDGKVLPIEVKSGKDYEVHRALSNIMDCEEYELPEAVVFNNDNLHVIDNIVYAPIYMAMFIEKNNVAPAFYKVDISGL